MLVYFFDLFMYYFCLVFSLFDGSKGLSVSLWRVTGLGAFWSDRIIHVVQYMLHLTLYQIAKCDT